MKGFIAKTMIGASMLVAAVVTVGCQQSPRRRDPCWPERYTALSRAAVNEPFLAQASNGHILDQTIWNWMFTTNENGDPELNADGQKQLVYLLRRRPAPDAKVFLQTAHDISFDSANPEQFIEDRSSLDNARLQVVQDFLSAQSAGRQMPVPFEVVVHDPAPVGTAGWGQQHLYRQGSNITADEINAVSDLFKTPRKTNLPGRGQSGGGSNSSR